MCWGCIGVEKIGHLVEVDGNMNQNQYISKLNNHLLPSARDILRRAPPDNVHQNDNVPPHHDRKVHTWKENQQLQRVHWPAYSVDMNVI